MRGFLARGLIGAAALSLGLAMPGFASADDPVRPELGAGPHRDRTPQTGGEGRPRQRAPAVPAPGVEKPGAASAGPSSPMDESSTREREEDERKATQNKEKMKKRPGYKEDVPMPQASRV